MGCALEGKAQQYAARHPLPYRLARRRRLVLVRVAFAQRGAAHGDAH